MYACDNKTIPQELRDKGVTQVDSPWAAAEAGEVVVLMVPDTPDVETVLFGERGMTEGLKRGQDRRRNEFDLAGRDKEFARRINDQGCRYLDAPVSGGANLTACPRGGSRGP